MESTSLTSDPPTEMLLLGLELPQVEAPCHIITKQERCHARAVGFWIFRGWLFTLLPPAKKGHPVLVALESIFVTPGF